MNLVKKKSQRKKTRRPRNKKTAEAPKSERGRIEKVTLKKPFVFNGVQITEAIIEIDHINFGLNKKTLKLNQKQRSNFTVADIQEFLFMLNDEYIAYSKIKGKKLRYEVRIDSPIINKFYMKQFVMVFETDFSSQNLIHTITLFPNW